MRFGTAVIDSSLPCWDRYGDRRYPFGIWKDLLSEEDLEGYRGRNGKELDPERIRAYFDRDGDLIVHGADTVLEDRITEIAEQWYPRAVDDAKSKECRTFPAGLMAAGYAEDLGNGIFRIGSGKSSAVIGKDLLAHIAGTEGRYYPYADILEIDTGSAKLDQVLREIFYGSRHHLKSGDGLRKLIEDKAKAKGFLRE